MLFLTANMICNLGLFSFLVCNSLSLYFFYNAIYQFVPKICVNSCHCVVGEQISTEMGVSDAKGEMCMCALRRKTDSCC